MGKYPARTFIVGGNWKCNGTRDSIKALLQSWEGADLSQADVEVVIAPPAVYCEQTRSQMRADFQMMVQNVWISKGGAFTGEMSADMVCDFGYGWAMTGHSERRSLPELAESDKTVAEKTKYCLDKGLSVMFCIGETLEERNAGQCDAVNQRQLKALQKVIQKKDWARIVIAYEPVWAIGTGVSCPPDKAQDTHQALRNYLKESEGPDVAAATRIVYGGSVTPANCQALSNCPDIDGFLVGGASLKPDFLKVIDSYKNCATKMAATQKLSDGRQVCIFRNDASMAATLVTELVTTAAACIAAKGSFSLAVPAGSVVNALKGMTADACDWSKVHVFFTNERLGANKSYQGALSAFVERCGIPLSQVHAGPAGSPAESAAAYEALLRGDKSVDNSGPLPSVDMMLLGVGEDGHCGTMHPGSEHVKAAGKGTCVWGIDEGDKKSIGMSIDMMCTAKKVILSACGAKKADAVTKAVTGSYAEFQCPAGLVTAGAGRTVLWYVDAASAAGIA